MNLRVGIISKKLLIIAVDGPSASGKGTVAKIIAEYFRIRYLDTGLLYRALAFKTLKRFKTASLKNALKIVNGLKTDDFNEPQLRLQKFGEIASKLAQEKLIRDRLLAFQRNFPIGSNGAVLDGRDIGSIVFPEAQIKLFVTANLSVRALRRQKEIKKMGENISLKDVEASLRARDKRDMNRSEAPLVCLDDAMLIDTSNIPFGSLKKEIIEIMEKKYKSLSLGSSE